MVEVIFMSLCKCFFSLCALVVQAHILWAWPNDRDILHTHFLRWFLFEKWRKKRKMKRRETLKEKNIWNETATATMTTTTIKYEKKATSDVCSLEVLTLEIRYIQHEMFNSHECFFCVVFFFFFALLKHVTTDAKCNGTSNDSIFESDSVLCAIGFLVFRWRRRHNVRDVTRELLGTRNDTKRTKKKKWKKKNTTHVSSSRRCLRILAFIYFLPCSRRLFFGLTQSVFITFFRFFCKYRVYHRHRSRSLLSYAACAAQMSSSSQLRIGFRQQKMHRKMQRQRNFSSFSLQSSNRLSLAIVRAHKTSNRNKKRWNEQKKKKKKKMWKKRRNKSHGR